MPPASSGSCGQCAGCSRANRPGLDPSTQTSTLTIEHCAIGQSLAQGGDFWESLGRRQFPTARPKSHTTCSACLTTWPNHAAPPLHLLIGHWTQGFGRCVQRMGEKEGIGWPGSRTAPSTPFPRLHQSQIARGGRQDSLYGSPSCAGATRLGSMPACRPSARCTQRPVSRQRGKLPPTSFDAPQQKSDLCIAPLQ